MDYNQPHPTMEPTNPQTGEKLIRCIDSKGNTTRWITPEESAEMSKDYDEEFMCPKPMASLLRRCREQQKMKS